MKNFFFAQKNPNWINELQTFIFVKKERIEKKKLMEIASGYHKNVAETIATCVKISENVFAVITYNMLLDIS